MWGFNSLEPFSEIETNQNKQDQRSLLDNTEDSTALPHINKNSKHSEYGN
jgi:hypothetical protein